jgi:hypothetical protein
MKLSAKSGEDIFGRECRKFAWTLSQNKQFCEAFFFDIPGLIGISIVAAHSSTKQFLKKTSKRGPVNAMV